MGQAYEGLTIEFGATKTGLSAALREARSEAKGTATELKRVQAALKLDPHNVELLSSKTDIYSRKLESARRELDALKAAEEKVGKGGMASGQWTRLQADIVQATAKVRDYERAVARAKVETAAAASGLGRMGAALEGAGTRIGRWGASLQGAGAAMTAAVTTTAVMAGVSAAKTAAEYETSVRKVSTLVDESRTSMEELSAGAREIATSFGVDAAGVNEAIYQALSASVDQDDVISFVSDATRLAKTGFTETATAVDTLTTIINAYGKSAEDTAHISDVLVNTQNLGKTTVNELGASMGQVIPTAAAYGVDLENLASAYVVLTKQGINTANATTYLSGMFTELANDGSEVSGILKDKTGKTFGQLMSDGASLGDVLAVLNDHVGGNSEEFANLWGNVRAGRGALAIANGGIDEFNGTLDSMRNHAGVVDEAMGKLMGSTEGTINKLKAEVNDAAITLGQAMLPILTDVVGGIKDAVDAFNGLSDEEKQNAVRNVAVAASIGPVLTALGTLMRSVTSVGQGLTSLSQFLARVGGAGKIASEEFKNMSAQAKAASVGLGALRTVGVAALVALVAVLISKLVEWRKRQQDLSRATDGLRDSLKKAKGPADILAGGLESGASAAGSTARSYRDLRGDVDDLVESQLELIDALDQGMAGAEADAMKAEAYAQVIQELAGNCQGSAEKLAELKAAVDGYNELTGAGIQVVDDYAGRIDAQTEAINRNTDAFRLNLYAKAYEDLWGEAIKRQVEARQAYEQNEAAIESATAQLGEYEQKMLGASTAEEADGWAAQMRAEQAEIDGLKRNRAELEELYGAAAEYADGMEESWKRAAAAADAEQRRVTDNLSAFKLAFSAEGVDFTVFDAFAEGLEMSSGQLADALTGAGIGAEELAGIGMDAFANLYQQADGDLGKVAKLLDACNAKGFDPKEISIEDEEVQRALEEVSGLRAEVDGLDGQSATIDVDVNDRATSTLQSLDRILKGLTGNSHTLQIQTSTGVDLTSRRAAGGIFPSGLGQAPRHADGGIFARPTLTMSGLVGEDGAEALIPLTNRRYVRPFAQAVASEMDGGTVNNSTVYNTWVDGALLAGNGRVQGAITSFLEELEALGVM